MGQQIVIGDIEVRNRFINMWTRVLEVVHQALKWVGQENDLIEINVDLDLHRLRFRVEGGWNSYEAVLCGGFSVHSHLGFIRSY